ncbi:MAG: anaerobic glycerol-3-phosphate dehydrogenase subunit B [Deinococcus sp.]|nr:anaerobic glycerol-3-phosphate dehydrogenase subunit B [Deinococcus sp.]
MGVRPLGTSYDLVIIGAGLAGFMAAAQALASGKKVLVVAAGQGSVTLQHGGVSLPRSGNLAAFAAATPRHPLALIGAEQVLRSLEHFRHLTQAIGLPYALDLQGIPTLTPTLGQRLVHLLPPTLADLRQTESLLIVGWRGFWDFLPLAPRLSRIRIRSRLVDFPHPAALANAVALGRAMDQPAVRQTIAQAVQPHLAGCQLGLFPQLGLEDPVGCQHHLQSLLGCPVAELPALPPSLPGTRLWSRLREHLRRQGARFEIGHKVVAARTQGGRCHAITVHGLTRDVTYSAQAFVLATGGLIGGGLQFQKGELREPIFNLVVPPPKDGWTRRGFFDPQGHPLFSLGLVVDRRLRPLGANGEPLYDNVFACGEVLGGGTPLTGQSAEALAIATGEAAARSVHAG